MNLEDKLRNEYALLPDVVVENILTQLNSLNDDLVLTFYRCSMSVLSGRLIELDGKEIGEETWIAYHRKLVSFTLDSLEDDD